MCSVGNVGRVGDNRVEARIAVQAASSRSPRRKSIRSATPSDAALRRGDRQRPLADIDRHEMALGLLMSRRDRQAARAGADVDAPGRLELASYRQVFGDDEFRLGSRDEHVRRDRKGRARKTPFGPRDRPPENPLARL